MNSFDIKRVANVIIFAIDEGVKFLGKTKLMKLLFFADKEHLIRYGRPIFFDVYLKEKMGPVPLNTYSIISSVNDPEKDDFRSEIDELLKWVSIEEKDVNQKTPMMVFKKKKEFSKELFSASEIKVLKDIFRRYKDTKANEISEISHYLPEYRKATMGGLIDYDTMAEDMADYVRFWKEEKEAFEKAISAE